MKRIYLIRHGLPEFPDGRRQCIGSTDLPLSGEGMLQASEMARALPTVSAVFSSPLTRAMETARAIRPDVAILDGLRELDYGQWEGLTFPEIRRDYPELYAARASDLSLQPPGAESREAGLARFSAAMAEAEPISAWQPPAAPAMQARKAMTAPIPEATYSALRTSSSSRPLCL